MAIVPDNLKSAVTRSDRNEPVINEEFAAFADTTDVPYTFYGYVIQRTRPWWRNAVKLLYRSVYADIEGLAFNSAGVS